MEAESYSGVNAVECHSRVDVEGGHGYRGHSGWNAEESMQCVLKGEQNGQMEKSPL